MHKRRKPNGDLPSKVRIMSEDEVSELEQKRREVLKRINRIKRKVREARQKLNGDSK